MIGLRDTWTLATTKLKVRRVRLIVTLVVSGILFTTLVFGSLVVRGTIGSLTSFMHEGFLSDFLVQVVRSGYSEPDKSYIDRVEKLENERIAAQVKEAKRLGIPFDPKTATRAVHEETMPDGTKQKFVTGNDPIAQKVLADMQPFAPLEKKARAAAVRYGAKGVYESYSFGMSYSSALPFDLRPIIKGAEVDPNKNGYGPGIQDSLTLFGNMLNAIDPDLMKPFLLDGVTTEAKAGEPIPILAPIDATEKMLGIGALPKKATPKQRIDRLREMREKAKDLTFEVCYRNSSENNLKSQAENQAKEIAAHKGEADYQKPSVVYAVGKGACAPTTIAADTRTADEKTLAAKQAEFDAEFGKVAPVVTRVKFRVVGILPQIGSATEAEGPESLISSFLTSTLGQGWYAALPAVKTNSLFGAVFSDYSLATGVKQLYIALPDRATQKRFMDAESCGMSFTSYTDPASCEQKGKIPTNPFGNPMAAMYETFSSMQKAGEIALGIIAALAAIVMMGTIGKVIADSRKETSVFRALGAKRLDIVQVYLLYTGILSALAYGVALGLGLAFGALVEMKYSPSLSAQAVLAFNSRGLGKTFHLIGFDAADLGLILVFALIVGLAGASLPLMGSVRRSPVKDMREE